MASPDDKKIDGDLEKATTGAELSLYCSVENGYVT